MLVAVQTYLTDGEDELRDQVAVNGKTTQARAHQIRVLRTKFEKGGWSKSFAKYIASRIVNFHFKAARDFMKSEFNPKKPFLFPDNGAVTCNMDEMCSDLVVPEEDAIEKCSQRVAGDKVPGMVTKLRCSTYLPMMIGDITIDVDQVFLIFYWPFFCFAT